MVIKNACIVVDLKSLISFFSSCDNMFWLYRRFPLKAIISNLLEITNDHDNYIELLMAETMTRLNVSEVTDEVRLLELFYEEMATEIEEHLYKRIQVTADSRDLVLDRWVDSTTILLRVK